MVTDPTAARTMYPAGFSKPLSNSGEEGKITVKKIAETIRARADVATQL